MAVQYAFGKIITQGLDLNVDAADPTSYPGSGTSWTSVVNRSITGSLVSCSYSTDFKGGIVFNNPSASVQFPGTVANYGTGSFTIEMAFRPSSINGIHYLVSKNSGSFPNWGVYLSGSGGSGKLFAEYNINASVSCSVSSSTVFVTGSVYQADIVLAPGLSGSGMSVDGVSQGTVLANGGGSLTSTSSLFVGSYSTNNTQNFSGSIYLVRAYSSTGFNLPVVNYNTTSTRFSKTPIPETARRRFELLVVAGGGGAGRTYGGGGGAGGLQYVDTLDITSGRLQVIVGGGGAGSQNNSQGTSGRNSTLGSILAIGGGGGGTSVNPSQNGINGGSGGGGSGNQGQGGGIEGLGTLGQGNNGAPSPGGTSGGGGGGSALVATGRNGGSGSFIPSFTAIGGSPAGWFAGGGAGGINGTILASGGIGGGGSGTAGTSFGTTGSINTGGGGGGGGFSVAGANGGSGIVAIRYNGTPIALGGEITQSEGFTYHVYRTVGTSSFTIF
jgi:hypothetical protein